MFTLCVLAIIWAMKGVIVASIIIIKIFGFVAGLEVKRITNYKSKNNAKTNKNVKSTLKTNLEDDIFNNVKGHYLLKLSGNNFMPIARYETRAEAERNFTQGCVIKSIQ
jgi:hypothetical protein